MTREAAVRRQVVTYLKSLAPRVAYRSNPASPFATAGDPDLFACVNGRLVCIELKRPGEHPTPVQVRRSPPLLGQHTDDVLAEIGVDATAARPMSARGII